MTNDANYYKDINQITWLLQGIKEKLRFIEKVAFPVYKYLDIVLSNEFCAVEATWKKSRMVVEAAITKYRMLLKRGLLNPEIIQRNIANYVVRIEILTIDGLHNLNALAKSRHDYVPPDYRHVQQQEMELLKLVYSLRSNPIVNIVKK